MTLLLLFPSPVLAQTPTGQPTCDLCGLCQGQPPPSNWNSCHACLYDESGTPKNSSYWTVIGCVSTQPEGFIKSIFSFLLSLAGGVSFLALLFGGGVILTSSGNPDRLNSGKEIFISAIVGLLLILFSVLILKIVGFDILRIPGFG